MRRKRELPAWNIYTYISSLNENKAQKILDAFDRITVPEKSIKLPKKAMEEIMRLEEGYKDEAREFPLGALKRFVESIFKVLEEVYPTDLNYLKSKVEESIKGCGDDPSQMSFQIIQDALHRILGGISFDELAESYMKGAFKKALSNWKGNSTISQQKRIISWNSEAYDSGELFVGRSQYRPFFVGLSKHESGTFCLLPVYADFCHSGKVHIEFKEKVPIQGSAMVSSIAFFKRGKVEIEFIDASKAEQFLKFCRTF